MEEEKGKSATPGSTRELPKLPKEVWAHIGSFLAKDGYLFPFSLTCAEFRDVAWELTVRRGDKGAGQVCQEGGTDEDRRRKNRRVGGEEGEPDLADLDQSVEWCRAEHLARNDW